MSARVTRYKQSGATGYVSQNCDNEDRDVRGYIVTPHGIVVASTWDDELDWRGVSLDMVHNGHRYVLVDHSRSLTARGLTTVAGRFARDVAAGRYEG